MQNDRVCDGSSNDDDDDDDDDETLAVLSVSSRSLATKTLNPLRPLSLFFSLLLFSPLSLFHLLLLSLFLLHCIASKTNYAQQYSRFVVVCCCCFYYFAVIVDVVAS